MSQILGQETTAKSRWDKLNALRNTVLSRGRQCAALTIPSILPPEGATENDDLPTPFQSIGARCVNNLAAKLYLALLPPGNPFFRYAINNKLAQEIQQDENLLTQVEGALAKLERSVIEELERNHVRTAVFQAVRALVAVGDALLYIPDEDSKAKSYRLDNYVIRRDPAGSVLEIIVKDTISFHTLSPEVQALVSSERKNAQDEDLDMYTYVHREGKKYKVFQEILEKVIPDSEGDYLLNECPWIPMRWSGLPGEHYGRGHVEEYLGDLRSHEALSMAIVEGSAAAAKVLFLVDPNGSTRKVSLAKGRSGDFIDGREADVSTLQLQKYHDFAVAKETIEVLESRLAQAFLLTSSVQRQAERVTAEEIRLLAGELEDTLGGVYSLLASELQPALVYRAMAMLRKRGSMPPLPKDSIKPVITTGLDALGRGHEATKMDLFLQRLGQFGPEVLMKYLKMNNVISLYGQAYGIDTKNVVKDEQQLMQEEQAAQQQAQQAQMMDMAKGPINEIAKGAVSQQAVPE